MELLASGRTADVYAIGDDRVLRRYRDGLSAEHEAAVMVYVAGLGYPVPTVFQVSGPDMLMERIDGPTMAEAMVTGQLDPEHGMEQLAALQTALHELAPRVSGRPGDRIIHLDLHAENVIMSERGPIVIDWCNATDGPPELDIAISGLIMAEIAVNPESPIAGLAAAAVPLFLAAAGRPSELMVDEALTMRLGNPSLSADEKDRLPKAADLIR
jgi:aminoglycoside phosphotransferase (APT) family kinase protein